MKPGAETRKPYSGTTRSLVLALDVGTTFSGVSYAILEPNEVPKIHGVTRFPGQEHVAGNSKIPSIMYYDKRGRMMAAGAEAENASIISQADDEGWTKAELFKLRLRPKSMKLEMNGMRLSPLPYGKTAVDVFGDFLGYLFRCTRNFFIDTHANGRALWNAVENDMQFVLSHPNGWEGAQQTKMRRSAVYGKLIHDTDRDRARIRFVTEGESSLHACVLNGLAADVLSSQSKNGFIVADAGGGTLDISSYAIRGTSPLLMEEIAPPDCVFAGSVFVSRRAREFLEEKLKYSKYGTPDTLDHIAKRFDETTKRLFRDKKDDQFIPFGSPLDRDLTVGIRNGQLKITGDEVAQLFEPSIEAAVASIRAQIDASKGFIKSVWLVGGFAASPWLFSQLQERLAPLGVAVSRPDSQTSKAVADGAIGFYCDHHVSARMSKFMYGVEFLREYNPTDPDHYARRKRLIELPSGPKLLQDAFDCILSRSVKVKESTVFSRKYCTELVSLTTLSVFEVEIWCFRGGNTVPQWILRESDEFSTLCVVQADLSLLSSSAEAKQGPNGKTYYTVIFSIEIHFGLTEFKARLKWVDNGHTKYGPASIVFNESGRRMGEDEPDSAPEDDLGVVSSRPGSKPTSRPRSRNAAVSPAYGGSGAPPVDLPNDPAYLEVPGRDTPRSADRSAPRSPSSPWSPTDFETVDDKGKRERGKETPGTSRSLGTPSKAGRSPPGILSDTLDSTWGKGSSPGVTFAPPPIDLFRAAGSPAKSDKEVKTPKHSKTQSPSSGVPAIPPENAGPSVQIPERVKASPITESATPAVESAVDTQPKDEWDILGGSTVKKKGKKSKKEEEKERKEEARKLEAEKGRVEQERAKEEERLKEDERRKKEDEKKEEERKKKEDAERVKEEDRKKEAERVKEERKRKEEEKEAERIKEEERKRKEEEKKESDRLKEEERKRKQEEKKEAERVKEEERKRKQEEKKEAERVKEEERKRKEEERKEAERVREEERKRKQEEKKEADRVKEEERKEAERLKEEERKRKEEERKETERVKEEERKRKEAERIKEEERKNKEEEQKEAERKKDAEKKEAEEKEAERKKKEEDEKEAKKKAGPQAWSLPNSSKAREATNDTSSTPFSTGFSFGSSVNQSSKFPTVGWGAAKTGGAQPTSSFWDSDEKVLDTTAKQDASPLDFPVQNGASQNSSAFLFGAQDSNSGGNLDTGDSWLSSMSEPHKPGSTPKAESQWNTDNNLDSWLHDSLDDLGGTGDGLRLHDLADLGLVADPVVPNDTQNAPDPAFSSISLENGVPAEGPPDPEAEVAQLNLSGEPAETVEVGDAEENDDGDPKPTQGSKATKGGGGKGKAKKGKKKK